MSVKTVVRQVSLPQLFHTGHIPADDPLEEHRLQAEHEDSNTSPYAHDAPQTHIFLVTRTIVHPMHMHWLKHKMSHIC